MLFFCLMLATTVSLAQNGAKITIKKNSISVIEALKEVERQSGMSVGYNDSQLKNKPAITLNIEAASLENALAQILKGTGFTYQLKEKYIMIIPEQKKESNPTKKITGKVVDENNDPLIGVNIKVEGTAAGSHRHRQHRQELVHQPDRSFHRKYTDIYLYRLYFRKH